MASLKELINYRVERLESVPDALQTSIDRQNEVLFKSILDDLNTLEVENGKLLTSEANLAKVGGIIEKLKQTLFGGEYVDAIKSFATEIKSQANLNNKILEQTIGSFNDNAVYEATVKQAQKNALLLLDETAVANNLLHPLADLLNNSIVNNVGYLDAVESLRTNMTGESALLSKYAGTYVKDTFAIADRQYVQLTSREHGIEFFRWDGGTVSDSREFCVERHDKIFHVKEIEAWGNHIKTRPEFTRPASTPVYTTKGGVKLYWEGENYDTNAATIKSYCGGYGCLHVLVPVATEFVPKGDIDRAVALGYYKLEVPEKTHEEKEIQEDAETKPEPRNYKNFERDNSLKGKDAEVQEKAIKYYLENRDKLVKQYIEKFGNTVNTDEARKLFKEVGYTGNNAAAVHEPSSQLAKDVTEYLMQQSESGTAAFFAGGAGSGKSSAIKGVKPEIEKTADVVIDGTLATFNAATKKIAEAYAQGKNIEIVYVYRDIKDAWVNGVIKRMLENASEGGRLVPLRVFLKSHLGAYENVLRLSDKLTDNELSIIDNSLGRGNQKEITVEQLRAKEIPSNIKAELIAETKKLLDAGRITKQQYEDLVNG